MSDFFATLQAALHTRLVSTPAVAARVGDRIYDHVPVPSETFPYIVLDEADSEYAGDKDVHGERVEPTVHVWSRHEGKREASEILEQVRLAIASAPLVIGNGALTYIEHRFATVFRDRDGQSYHGVIRFRAHIERA